MSKQNIETLTSRITSALKERIIVGAIPPGARLRQDHIATEFSASHVPVREAFRELEALGLAESNPHRGVSVTRIDIEEFAEVAEMRARLEPLALQHAIPYMTSEIIDKAEEITKTGDKCDNVHEWEGANRKFHDIILRPCGMSRLLKIIEHLQITSSRFLFASWRSGWESRTDYEHREIIAALRNNQADRACLLLSKHVGWNGKRKSASKNAAEIETYQILG